MAPALSSVRDQSEALEILQRRGVPEEVKNRALASLISEILTQRNSDFARLEEENRQLKQQVQGLQTQIEDLHQIHLYREKLKTMKQECGATLSSVVEGIRGVLGLTPIPVLGTVLAVVPAVWKGLTQEEQFIDDASYEFESNLKYCSSPKQAWESAFREAEKLSQEEYDAVTEDHW